MNNMLQPSKQKKLLVSAKTPLGGGQTKVSSYQSGLLKEPDCITSTSSLKTKTQKLLLQKKTSATAESLPKAKKTISKDKLPSCKKNTLPIKSSQISDHKSTSKEKVFDPSSSWLQKEESEKLWLPTEIGCADLHLNWWSGSFKSIKSNSWFSIKKWIPLKRRKWQKTFLRSSMFSIAELTEEESTKVLKQRKSKLRKSVKPVANKSLRVGLRPTREVSNTFKRWFGCVRHTYNWALGCIKAKPKQYKKTDMV